MCGSCFFGIIIIIIIIIIIKQTENYRKEIVSRVWGVWWMFKFIVHTPPKQSTLNS
jgi:hypothetical protein